MCFSAPKQPVAAPPAPTVMPDDPAVLAARDRERRRLAVARSGSTTLSTPGSVAPQPTQPKALYGA